jgi:uncharacterized membrane protein
MARDQFTDQDLKQIKEAIWQAELKTSGEIKVHIENHCKEEVMDRAAYLFETLEMHKTELRNGVLFYLAIEDHQLAILGDVGINMKVPEHFWDDIYEEMKKRLQQQAYTEAIVKGVGMAASQLQTHFPYRQDDTNELSNDISFGK